MAEKKVGIIAECVCDLPRSIIEEYDIDIVYFLIQTDSGVFTDTDEITADNILEYMDSGGKKSKSSAPSVEVYVKVFGEKLKQYEEVFLPTISSGISDSYENAVQAVKEMGDAGKNVHVFDTGHLSTGLGHMVIRAAELAWEGKNAKTITAELDRMKNRVSTSFIAVDVSYLYRNGKISKKVKDLCELFNAHPVLTMKNGKLAPESIKFGNNQKAYIRYIRKKLRNSDKIDKTRLFITHAGLPSKSIEAIKSEINKLCSFEEITVTKASATVSSNCGPGTVGVLFVKKQIEE